MPIKFGGSTLQTVAPQRLPQMHNGKIIIIAYKMLMGSWGVREGAWPGTKQDPGAMESWQNVWQSGKGAC